MNRQIIIVLSANILLGTSSLLSAQDKKASSYEHFDKAEIYFEQNTTDGDAEVVIKAKAGKDGMTKLKVITPDGRTIVDFNSPDPTTMGIRQFHLESPEPEDIEAVKKAFPEGIYKFFGTTTDGEEYMDEAALSHALPTPIAIKYPADKSEDIPTKDLEITWEPIENAEVYLIEVEQDDLDIKVEAKLSNSETSFSVPAKFLHPDLEYKIVIGAESVKGNLNFVETSFTTAKE